MFSCIRQAEVHLFNEDIKERCHWYIWKSTSFIVIGVYFLLKLWEWFCSWNSFILYKYFVDLVHFFNYMFMHCLIHFWFLYHQEIMFILLGQLGDQGKEVWCVFTFFLFVLVPGGVLWLVTLNLISQLIHRPLVDS